MRKNIFFRSALFSLSTLFVASMGLHSAAMAQEKPWQSIGRGATVDEVKAWDIDVRGDFKGLPKGRGTVARGEKIWDDKCASCHGVFGESNEVFPPLIGGTTAEDMKTGIVAANAQGNVAQRTTMMKLARLSTMWDYINRAMPWNAPKSLSTDEVYSVVAYILNLSAVVPSDFTLSDENIAEVQKRLPNRNGLMFYPGLWDIKGKPDVHNVACMKDCPTEAVSSSLPDFARNAHGNLAEQNRVTGAVRGADTTKPPLARLSSATSTGQPSMNAESSAGKLANKSAGSSAGSSTGNEVQALLAKNSCTACHAANKKIVGPSFNEIANKYQAKPDAESYLIGKIKAGGAGVWGSVPMPPQAQLKDGELKTIASWILTGSK